MKALLLPRKSHKTPASLRASAHAGVAAPRMNVGTAVTEESPLLLGEGAERSEAGVEGTRYNIAIPPDVRKH